MIIANLAVEGNNALKLKKIMKNKIESDEHYVERLLTEAAVIAHNFKADEMRPEHLLYVISGTEEGRRTIESMGGTPRKIRAFLSSTFEFNAAQSTLTSDRTQISALMQRVIQPSVSEARLSKKPITLKAIIQQMIRLGDACRITREALRTGGLIEGGSMASPDDYNAYEEAEDQVLSGTDAAPNTPHDGRFAIDDDEIPEDGPTETLQDIVEKAQSTEPVADGARLSDTVQGQPQQAPGIEVDEHHTAVLASIRDLSEQARRNMLDDVVCRDETISRIVDTLCRRTKRNVILSGEPGVGKSAIAEGLAAYLASDEAPEMLRNRPLLEVSLSDLVAGARFRGDFEARMRKLLDIARVRKAILFMDEFHTIMGAGASSGGGMNASNILKPALARGDICVIGATTPFELREIRKDRALMRRFRLEVVEEPSTQVTRMIIDQAVGSYALHHEIMMGDDILDEVVALADRYLKDRQFPDKAFDLIDTSCVIAKRRGSETVSMSDLRGAIHQLGGPRLGKPDPARVTKVASLEAFLNTHVVGQKQATSQLSKAARLSLLGLQPGGIAGSYLFNGPTGVGKTEMAEKFAQGLGLPIVAISMSEFIERQSVARLIGAPPGYVGFEDEGILTAAGEAYPEFVLLLDEIEKAHPDVFDIMLQILDKGYLRAGDGRLVSFRGAHVILTANIGASESEKPAIGFGRQTDTAEVTEAAKARLFRKEFRARVQKEIQFNAIGEEELQLIATLELGKIARRLADSAVQVTFDADLAPYLAKLCRKDSFASRSLQDRIRTQISDQMVDVILDNGGADAVHVGINDGEISIQPR